MNNKGFTLTELIVTIALLGVVMAMAFPAITRLQTENQKQVYETYEKVLLNGAKLYVDKYGRDLWDGFVSTPTCVKITYEHLRYEDLIKEFSGKKGEEVYSDKTVVYATKLNNSVTYMVNLVVKNNRNNIVYNSDEKVNDCSTNDLPTGD